jgi:CheY-like chemotaxis protein
MDSRELFCKQIQAHTTTLCDLLASPGAEILPAGILELSMRGTRMLAGSADVMAVGGWAELCTAFEGLLRRYEKNRIPWDDRIADVTSELIEKEETMVAAFEADPTVDFNSVIPAEETAALISELGVLDEECQSFDPAPEMTGPAEHSRAGTTAPMSGVVEELHASFERARARLESESWKSRDWRSTEVDELRRELGNIEFCARSIKSAIGDSTGRAAHAAGCDLSPLRVALADFATERSHSTGRTLTVDFSDDGPALDPELLSAAAEILRPMIDDTLSRCDGDAVHVWLIASQAHGAVRWSLSDDGNNFVSDSLIDDEDHLAFYPGLRGAINLLGRHRGVLWVEPGEAEGPRSRFEFTLPASGASDALVVWRFEDGAFALRAAQVCDVLLPNDASMGSDEHGQYVALDGMRIPLLRLDTLYSQAPATADAIAVVGSIEKRIAFFVPGQGESVKADVFDATVPVWPGASPIAAQIDERRVPVLDADGVLSAYHAITGALSTEQLSGGVSDEVPEVTPCQATSKEDGPAPPALREERPGENGVEVLVVEQSESAREALLAILSRRNVRAVCAADANDAIALVDSLHPRLIISEFRMPSMAAKLLIDALDGKGREIPVLVTTSQAGKTADLLVEKLRAAGYISRPLDADAVNAAIKHHLDEVPH